MTVETSLEKDSMGNNLMLIKVALDRELLDSLGRGEGIGKKVAELIAKEILPEMRMRVLEDPVMKDRIVNEVLLILANRMVDEAHTEGEKKLV